MTAEQAAYWDSQTIGRCCFYNEQIFQHVIHPKIMAVITDLLGIGDIKKSG
tara:strand:+ start:481 stop:633 length:153 start_codon:yes stop_codon:yes gene_type:complete